MTNELTVPMNDLERMARAMASSGLFGVKSPDQALALMLISHAEGRHPALAAKDYDIIQGKPAKKADAMLRDFLSAGGKVEWHELTDAKAEATFSHPQGGSFRCDWDMKRAATAGFAGKDNWKKFPRAMLRSRVVSEGVRTVFPAATSGMYVPEEVTDFSEPKDITPPVSDKPKRVTADPLADAVAAGHRIALATQQAPQEPPAPPAASPQPIQPSPAGGAPSPDTVRGKTPLSLPFLNGNVVKECTSRPQWLSLMEAAIVSMDTDALLELWDANMETMGDIQAKALEWVNTAKPKDKPMAQEMFDRCAAVYNSIHELQKAQRPNPAHD